jgi:hypothetical protein
MSEANFTHYQQLKIYLKAKLRVTRRPYSDENVGSARFTLSLQEHKIKRALN